MEVFFIKALDENGQVKGMEKSYDGFPTEELQRFVADKYCSYLVEISKGVEFLPFE